MLIVGPDERETAERLAEMLDCECVGRDDIYSSSEFVINYGGSYREANLNPYIYFDKLKAHEILESKKVKVPKIWKDIKKISRRDLPVFGRLKYHSQGQDIVNIKTKQELEKLIKHKEKIDFFTKYISKVEEYRVHVLGDKVASISIKKKRHTDANEEIRCSNNGWTHVEYKGEMIPELSELGIKAVRALNYDFGAVDIILSENFDFYVLEVNSGPRLNRARRKLYCNYFVKEKENFNKKRG